MYRTTEALFESFFHHRPEGKLELIEGRLIVGNAIVGSRLLLQQILQGWRAEAAIALAPIETWIEALQRGFHLGCPTEGSGIETALNILEAAAVEFEYQPEDLLTGQGVANFPYHPHHGVRQYLSTGLNDLAEDLCGRSLGRGFVMRLGHNGFTPHLMFFKSQTCFGFYNFLAGFAFAVLCRSQSVSLFPKKVTALFSPTSRLQLVAVQDVFLVVFQCESDR